jgi:predicted adenylyl cyclase CyaB
VPIEQEVKLEFPDVRTARDAVIAAGGQLAVARRLVDDRLFDTADDQLRRAGSALRLRDDGAASRLTWKGPVQAGPVKSREEIETSIGDVTSLHAILRAVGYRQHFRAQKYREEYALGAALVTVDDTPAGVYVEIEATPDEIARITALLGRTPADYCLDSYPALWRRWCAARNRPVSDMMWERGSDEQ